MIKRDLYPLIKSEMFGGKVIIITGPRQVGKTTLAKEILENSGVQNRWFNADEPDVRKWLTNPTSTQLKQLFGGAKLVIIDEAQRISNIGITLKLAVENIPSIQILATGSSALELADGINEPLTGRKWEFSLYPFSFSELTENNSINEETRLIEHRMIFGYYPEVVNNPGREQLILNTLINSYLFKDILSMEKVRKPLLVEKILQALAFQIGSEVSFNEIARIVKADNQTIERYIDLLEKVYIVFSISSFSRNLRNELKRSRKVYFFDNGIRNAIINNFNSVSLRNDTGALWENFLMSERLKYLHYRRIFTNRYFWRTTQQQEIDYLEESAGKLSAYEFKWSERAKARIPAVFKSAYPDSKVSFVNKENFSKFILPL
jgi:uncharacterized protein